MGLPHNSYTTQHLTTYVYKQPDGRVKALPQSWLPGRACRSEKIQVITISKLLSPNKCMSYLTAGFIMLGFSSWCSH